MVARVPRLGCWDVPAPPQVAKPWHHCGRVLRTGTRELSCLVGCSYRTHSATHASAAGVACHSAGAGLTACSGNEFPRQPGGRRHAAAHACLRQAQERIQAAGFSPGPLDGWLGPHTRMVLRRYQQRKGLRVTGTLDAQTLKALAPGNGVPWSVDGILVVFQVDPHRARYASSRPARARTQSGRGHAIVQADLAGQVRITVRVGPSRNERRSQSSCPSPREKGMQMRAAHDREQLMCSWT
jgi:hypothetical protein